MINKNKLSKVLEAYRRDFHKKNPENKNQTQWESEGYKWVAVKWFQDNWDLEAEDFGAMFRKATEKCFNLLAAQNYFPRSMMIVFAQADQEAVRNMFRNLYDESQPVAGRVEKFISEAERVRKTYGETAWKLHYQNLNSVSVYLWLMYPDKYHIYKYSECKKTAQVLEGNITVKKGANAEILPDVFSFYDEIAEFVSEDSATVDMVRAALTKACYPDPANHILAGDIGFYISRWYKEGDAAASSEPEPVYWPSQEEYPLNLTKEDWKRFIEEVEFPHHKGCVQMLKALVEQGGEASCKKLSQIYGESPTKYIGSAVNTGKRAKKYFNLPPCMDGDVERFFPIPFLGRKVIEDGEEYYSYKLRDELHAALKEMDLSSIDPYGKTASDEDTSGEVLPEEGCGCWWLNANPKIWSFSDIAVGAQQSYTLYNENGNKRRIFQNFLDAKAGDLVIGYESTPVKQVVAVARISRAQDGKELVFEKVEGLANPIDYQTLRDCPELQNMEYFCQPQGSLFRLTKDEFDFIMDLIREENPAAPAENAIEKYTREDFLSEVYMSSDQYDSLVSLLKNKSNLILQGAPGVGKTFAAKRLAYAVMGEKDESRIEFVQFHQNYSYEDFMMGYKPSGDGFELKYGVFYRFCMLAANHPDKEYFFIIDEINRGNMSKIFGELLMLIEKDYRGKKATLAYNGMSFSVPENLYIIGMMNTADRSLAMIDYALRRRFSFFTMTPGFDSKGFKDYQAGIGSAAFDRLVDVVRDLNKDISKDKSLGPGFCIGHSYFCGHKAEENESWVRGIAEYDLIPMLQEYWFDDSDSVQKWTDLLRGVFHG